MNTHNAPCWSDPSEYTREADALLKKSSFTLLPTPPPFDRVFYPLQMYRRLTYDLTDLLQLSRAEVLVGVSSSDTDNVAGLLRAGGGKPRESKISVDVF